MFRKIQLLILEAWAPMNKVACVVPVGMQEAHPSQPPNQKFATWAKNIMLAHYCEGLSIANKREIFAIMRNKMLGPDVDPGCTGDMYHMYLPKIGLTLGECSLFHTISEHLRRHNNNGQNQSLPSKHAKKK